jgi:hypothetical protein
MQETGIDIDPCQFAIIYDLKWSCFCLYVQVIDQIESVYPHRLICIIVIIVAVWKLLIYYNYFFHKLNNEEKMYH